jgi:hypothetical protein
VKSELKFLRHRSALSILTSLTTKQIQFTVLGKMKDIKAKLGEFRDIAWARLKSGYSPKRYASNAHLALHSHGQNGHQRGMINHIEI